MLFIQSYLDRRVEIREIDGKINPVIIHPRAQVHFGLALKDNSSLVLIANILGTNDSVYLNQHYKVRIQPENDIYKQAHIVIAGNSDKQNEKLSPYKTQYGGDNRLNISTQIQSLLENKINKDNQPKDIVLIISFRNTLGAVVEVSEITGAVEPILLLPYEIKTMRLVVKRTWPLIFHASSGNNLEQLQVNGQRQLRIYLPLETDMEKEVTITGRQTTSTQRTEEVKAVMLSINNTLRQAVVLFDVSNTMRPLVVPEAKVCQVGFFVRNASFVVLSGVTIGKNATSVELNGKLQIAVQSSQNPAEQNLIVLTKLSSSALGNESTSAHRNTQSSSTTNVEEDHSTNEHTSMVSIREERFVMLDIHNTLDLAVKFIELTGAHKPFIVPSRTDARLGFSVLRNGPIVLRAVLTDSNEKVLLNKQNSIRVEPSLNTTKLTEIIVSGKAVGKFINKRLIRPSLPRLILMHK